MNIRENDIPSSVIPSLPPLIQRLIHLRSAIHFRLVCYGGSVVVIGGVASFFFVVVLDWVLHLPTALRILVATFFLTGFVAAVVHWVVRPLEAKLSLMEIAARLEKHFGGLHDRLISTVNFLVQGSTGSPAMTQRVVERAEKETQSLNLESLLVLRPLVIRVVLMLVCIGTLAASLWTPDGWARTGLHRYVYPWGRLEWPRSVTITPITHDQIAAIGESVTTEMAVRRGLTPTLRGEVHFREADGETHVLAMQRRADGEFVATINMVTTNLHYWFVAGDDTTADRPALVEVVRRPEIIQAAASIHPPPYATFQAPITTDLAEGSINVALGGSIRIDVLAGKVIPTATDDHPVGLRLENGTLIPLQIDPADPQRLSVRFEITNSLAFRIELHDTHGFNNRGADLYHIHAMPDEPPMVTIVEPISVIESTPQGIIPVFVRVQDDFGLSYLSMDYQTNPAELSVSIPLSDQLEVEKTDAGVEAQVRFEWNLEPLGLKDGDVVNYVAHARDNRHSPTLPEQQQSSASMQIRIISNAEFDARIRSELASLETKIRDAILTQARLLDQTNKFIETTPVDGLLPPALQDIASIAASEQARLVRRLHDTAKRFASIALRMDRNQAGTPAVRESVSDIENGLRATANGPTTTARDHLNQVTRRQTTQDTLIKASAAQQETISELQSLLVAMAQWGTFQELVGKTRDIAVRQDTLRRRTGTLGQSMMGKPLQSLSQRERSALKSNELEQDQLRKDTLQLLARLRKLHGSAKPASADADALEDAIRAAGVGELEKQLRSATEAIATNRTATATIAQKGVAETLRKMTSALERRDTRRLEELRKLLVGAQDEIAAIIEQQEALHRATRETQLIQAPRQAWNELSNEQARVRTNTRSLGDEFAGRMQTAPATPSLFQAVRRMMLAESNLKGRNAQDALAAQAEAIEYLERAHAALVELAEKAEREWLRRSLDQIRENLELVLADQIEVNEGIVSLVDSIDRRGHLGRRDARTASKLVRRQGGVITTAEELEVDFEQVVVYRWALERNLNWMASIRNRLIKRNIDSNLQTTGRRIVHSLENLIRAITQTQALPVDTQFVESSQGGGQGTGSDSKSKVVPSVTELLVLRAMQEDVNVRTTTMHASQEDVDPTERQLRDRVELGEDQAEVKRLAELVIEKARQP